VDRESRDLDGNRGAPELIDNSQTENSHFEGVVKNMEANQTRIDCIRLGIDYRFSIWNPDTLAVKAMQHLATPRLP
jgi:hypothetical protein